MPSFFIFYKSFAFLKNKKGGKKDARKTFEGIIKKKEAKHGWLNINLKIEAF
jgi:hypothetical protein